MFKNFKKRSLKGKIIIVTTLVLLLTLIVYVLYSTFKPEPPKEYEMAQVKYGSMTEVLDVSGKVESGVSNNFEAVEGVMVEEVFVDVGDHVNKGDKLASFNISGGLAHLNDVKKDYDEAQKEYDNAVKNKNNTDSKKSDLSKQITDIKAQIDAKKNEVDALEKKLKENAPKAEEITISKEEINKIVEDMKSQGATKEEIDAFISGAEKIKVPNVSKENIDAQQELLKKKLDLAELNSQLASLSAENATVVQLNSDKRIDTLKKIADAKKEYYLKSKEVFDIMKNGWYAENDGIVTAVNLEAGKAFTPKKEDKKQSIDLSSIIGGESLDDSTMALVSSLLNSNKKMPSGTGITVESYEDMVVTVTVGKSDLLKIKKGMKATVLSLDKEYEGEVIYVGATANEQESIDINSITSSLMGSSGAGGAIVKVKINAPDEKVVLGFDVDIKIDLSKIDDVLTVPVEAVLYNSGVYSVYVYNEKKGIAEKHTIEKGMLDDKSYQVIDGLAEGDKVIKSPDPDMPEGTRIKEKTA